MGALQDTLNLAVENLFLFGVMFIVTLSLVISIHEFGHYIVARWCGVYVEQFALGFGREVIGFQKKGERRTRFSICLFPLGGFVKLFGDVNPDNPLVWDKENDKARRLTEDELQYAYCTKNVWQRIAIVAAGPAINLLLCLVILIGVYTVHGHQSSPNVITAVHNGSAAEAAGIQIGDKILEMDGKALRRLDDIFATTWSEDPPQEHIYTVLRDNEELTISYTAKRVSYVSRKGVESAHGQTGMVHMQSLYFKDIRAVNGVSSDKNIDKARALVEDSLGDVVTISIEYKDDILDDFTLRFPPEYNVHLSNQGHKYYDRVMLVHPDSSFFLRLTIWESTTTAVGQMIQLPIDTYRLIAVAHKGKTDKPVIGGVARISQSSAEATQGGLYSYALFLAFFSLTIAIINLLPIPALDGGYLVFLTYEVIAGKPLSQRVQDAAIIVGLVILVGIMIIGNVSDLLSFLNSIQSD